MSPRRRVCLDFKVSNSLIQKRAFIVLEIDDRAVFKGLIDEKSQVHRPVGQFEILEGASSISLTQVEKGTGLLGKPLPLRRPQKLAVKRAPPGSCPIEWDGEETELRSFSGVAA